MVPVNTSCDVLIVGYGPVGMFQAALLAQSGLKVIVVEKYQGRYPLPRAAHMDGEVLRTLQQLGIADAAELIMRPNLSYGLVTAEMELLEKISLGENGCGWKASYMFYQPEIEELMHKRATELGVQLVKGTAVDGLEQKDSRVLVTARPRDSSEVLTFDASYVIGCDGAGSFVREHIGSKRRDQGFEAIDNLVVDFQHNDPDRDIPNLDECFQVVDIHRPTLAARWIGSDWSRWEFTPVGNETREHMENEDTCWKLLAPWSISPETGKIIRRTIYRFESSLTDHWRNGRVLLMGDAAHTMPPFMGQGMCSGFRDAFNLTWKLIAVLHGRADISLLDTYQMERSSHVEQIIHMSMAVGRNVVMTDPVKARLRDEALRAGIKTHPGLFPRLIQGIVRSPDTSDASDTEGRPGLQARVGFNGRLDRLDQFLAPGWRIISRHAVALDLFSPHQQVVLSSLQVQFIHVSRGNNGPDNYIDIDGDYDVWFRKHGRKAFLQRPDCYIYGAAERNEDLPKIIDELAKNLTSHGWREFSTGQV